MNRTLILPEKASLNESQSSNGALAHSQSMNESFQSNTSQKVASYMKQTKSSMVKERKVME